MRIRRTRTPKRLPRRKAPPPPELDSWEEDILSPTEELKEAAAPEAETERSDRISVGASKQP